MIQNFNSLQQKVEGCFLQLFFLEKLSCLEQCDRILFSQVPFQKIASAGEELRDIKGSSYSHHSDGIQKGHVKHIRVQKLTMKPNEPIME